MKNNNVFGKLFNKNVLNKIQRKIDLAVLNSKFDAVSFLSIRIITTVLVFIIVFSSFKYGYIWAIFYLKSRF